MKEDVEEPPRLKKARKERSDKGIRRYPVRTALDVLTDEQHQDLCRWMLKTRMTYPEIVAKMKKEFGIETNRWVLARYYTTHITAYLIGQRQRNIDVVRGMNMDLARNHAEFVPATIDTLKRLAWTLSNDPDATAKQIKIIFELVLRFEEQEIRRSSIMVKMRRMDLMEKKQKEVEDAARDTKLTNEQFAERIRQIFKRDATQVTNGQTKVIKPRQLTDGITP